MTQRFEERVALVTGGASGIGAATARRFISEGARIMLADRDEALGKQVASDLGDHCAFHKVDVSDLGQVEEMVEATVDQFGRLDVLFNNAGIGDFGETPDLDPDACHTGQPNFTNHFRRLRRDSGSQ
jgi:meso-butanediol dehydrogenase/(S,S)-butanediol dehydrogenase/diacetyl reductase